MSSFAKRVLKIFAVLFAFICLIVLLLPTICSQTPVKDFILNKVNDGISGKIQVEKMDLGWMSGLDLQNIQINDPNGNEVLSCKRVQLNDSLFSLLKSPTSLGELKIVQPKLTLVEEKDGSNSLENSFASKTTNETPSAKNANATKEEEKASTKVNAQNVPQQSSSSEINFSSLDLSVENGSIAVQKNAQKPITISDLNCKISLQGKKAQVTAKALLVNGDEKGSLDLNVQAENVEDALAFYMQKLSHTSDAPKSQNGEVTLNCNIDNFPVASIEPFMTMADPKFNGLMSALLGKTLDLELQHKLKNENFSLTCFVKSPYIQSDLQVESTANELVIAQPIKLSYHITPELVQKLSELILGSSDIRLKNETTCQFQVSPTTVSLPISSTQTKHTPLSLRLNFSQPLVFQKQGSNAQDISLQLAANLTSESIYDQILAKLSGSLQSGGNSVTLNSDLSLQNLFAKEMPKGALSLNVFGNVAQIATLFVDPKSIPLEAIGPAVNMQINSDLQNIGNDHFQASGLCKIQSDALKVDTNFTLFPKREHLDIANFAAELKLSADKIQNLAKAFQLEKLPSSTAVSLKLNLPHAEIPFDLPAKMNEAAVQGSLTLDPMNFSNVDGINSFGVDTFHVSLTKEKYKDLQLKSEQSLDLQNSAQWFQNLIGKKISSVSSFRVVCSKDLLEIQDIRSDILSDALKFQAPKVNLAILPNFKLQVVEKVEAGLKVKQTALALLLNLSPEALMVQDDFTLKAVLDPNVRQNSQMKGKCIVDDLKIGTGRDPIASYQITAPFELDLKNSEIKANCELSSLNKNDETSLKADLLFGYGVESKKGNQTLLPALRLKSDIDFKNVPLKPFAQIAKKEEFADLLGNTLSGSVSVDYKGADSDANPIQVKLQAEDLLLEIGLNIADQIEALSHKNALKLHLNVSPARFRKALKTFKLANSQNFELASNVDCNLTVSKLKVPLAIFSQNENGPKITLGKFLDSTELETQLDVGRINLQSKANSNGFSLLPLTGKAQLLKGSKNLSFSFNTVGNEAASPKIVIAGTAKNLWDDNSIKLDDANVEINCNIEELPVDLINNFVATKDTGEKLGALFGSSLSCEASGKVVKMTTGVLQAEVKSENFQAEIFSSVRDGKLYLNKPIVASCKLTGDAGKVLFKDVNPLLATGVKAENPIQITVDHHDFVIPLKPFSLNQVQCKKATVELGKLKVKKGGILDGVIALLNMTSLDSNHMKLWFTPLYFEIRNGLVICKRADAMIDDHTHIATWGTINLISDRIDMVIGVTGDSLIRALHLTNIGRDYMLQIPLRGTTSNPEVDSKRATAKIAALKMVETANPTAALLGGIIGIAASVGEEDAPVPQPSTSPFPWDLAKSHHSSY